MGSSPRVWGQVSSLGFPIACCRIIPTRVGTRLTQGLQRCALRDHPHACGDKLDVLASLLTVVGSSPRVWGQVIYNNYLRTPNRIIPTRVGTRKNNKMYTYPFWDHPHACGDKQAYAVAKYYRLGSSPRVWGQDTILNLRTFLPRIIPTRVGTS